MGTIVKNHFALAASAYHDGIQTEKYDVSWPENMRLERIPATIGNYQPLIEALGKKWDWDKQPRYQGQSLRSKLADPQAALYLLKDGKDSIGYAFVASPSGTLQNRFFQNASVIEFENLGMFPGYEGGGRGKKYFEMLFAEYFRTHDHVYWSQHETHSPTLKRYYQEKLGMELLDQDLVPDFRIRTPALV